MDLTNRAGDFRWRNTVTNPPSSHRISFRHRIHDHGPVAHSFDLRHRDVRDLCAFAWIEDVLVDFVREAERVELLTKTSDEFHLVASENLARRIVWVANDNRPGLCIECRA